MRYNDKLVFSPSISQVVALTDSTGFIHFDKAPEEGGRLTGTTVKNVDVFFHASLPPYEKFQNVSLIDKENKNRIKHYILGEDFSEDNPDIEQNGYSVVQGTAGSKKNPVRIIIHYDMEDNLTGVTLFSLPLEPGDFLYHLKVEE